MSTPTTVRVAISSSRQPAVERVLDVSVTPDDRLLLPAPEAAQRIDISRRHRYDLIAADRIPVVHMGRSATIRADTLAACLCTSHAEGRQTRRDERRSSKLLP